MRSLGYTLRMGLMSLLERKMGELSLKEHILRKDHCEHPERGQLTIQEEAALDNEY